MSGEEEGGSGTPNSGDDDPPSPGGAASRSGTAPSGGQGAGWASPDAGGPNPRTGGPSPYTGPPASPYGPPAPPPYGGPTPGPYGGPAPGPYGGPPRQPLPAATVNPADLRPRRLWFVLAAVIIVAGLTTGAVLAVGLLRDAGPTRTFAANETVTVQLKRSPKPGFYVTDAGSPSDRCFARDTAGRQIWAEPISGQTTITINNTRWHVLSFVSLPADGTFQVGCVATAADTGARYGVGTPPETRDLLTTILAMIVLWVGSIAIGLVIIIVVAVRRGTNRRRLLAGPMPR